MYLNYCRNLQFEETPDYLYLRQLFRILFRTLGHKFDFLFDWTLLKRHAEKPGPSCAAPAISSHSENFIEPTKVLQANEALAANAIESTSAHADNLTAGVPSDNNTPLGKKHTSMGEVINDAIESYFDSLRA